MQYFLAAVILGPVVEEFLFRGLILRGFFKHYSYKKAIFISSLLFAIYHMNPWQFLSSFCAGIFFGWCFYKTNSLLICILAHSFFNFISFIYPLLVKLIFPEYIFDYSSVTFIPPWIVFLGLILSILGVFLLNKVFDSKFVARS
ncbi:lysostaphin resistance A-like protein [Clostridium grantii]|uniref:CPBP family intramembrane glutamic endopeptidase n=1 Tax=Clostridium grantii TaxID=40575 RepID=UPI003BFA6BDB